MSDIPGSPTRTRWLWRSAALAVAAGATAAMFACSDGPTQPDKLVTGPLPVPQFGVSDPSNGSGQCMGDDAVQYNARVDGVSAGDDPATVLNCTANDISIAIAIVNSVNGQAFDPQADYTCAQGDTVELGLTAILKETASSERQDVGVWIATDGGAAQSGTCNHYNLTSSTIGATNFDGDACLGIAKGDSAFLNLGTLKVPCENVNANGNLHIGSCLSWKVPSDDQECPDNADGILPDGQPTDFRAGTLPSNKSKCNCDGFDVPIRVLKTATLEVKKVCQPSNDSGTFDLLIDGDNQYADDVACGGTTGAQTVTAGDSQNPGANHTVSENDFDTSAYTSTYACTVNGHSLKSGSGTSVSGGVDVLPDSAYVCTFTNTRLGKVVIEKQTLPDGATDWFRFVDNLKAPADTFRLQDDGVQVFDNVPLGSHTVVEDSIGANWDIQSIACTAKTGSAIVNLGTRTVTLGVAAGDSIKCTFTNRERGSITIIKDTQNPETDAKDFAFSTTGGLSPSSFSLDDDADNTLSNTQSYSNVPAGSYSVTEGAESEWALTAINCSGGGANTTSSIATRTASIGLDPGEAVTCTFVNQRKAELVVTKTILGGGSQTFEFSRTGISNFFLGDGGSNDSGFSLTPGNYTVCELNLAVSWAATATVNGGSATLDNPDFPQDLGNRCVTVALGYGDVTTVAWTNRPPPGGNARTIGYWKNWSSCTNGNQIQTATKNNMLDKTLDYYLPSSPAVFPVGDITSMSCTQAVRLLDKSDINTGKKQASDPAYNMAAQLFAAKLNYAAGADQCPAATSAISDGQALLDAIDFTGTGTYKNKMSASQISQANTLAGILDSYNNNTLCGP